MIATPEVTLIAHTAITAAAGGMMEQAAGDMDTLAEQAGRACYRAEHKPNPATAANVDYLANIIRQQHTSVLEHASASFYITGVSRAFLAEITRHRHLSFSVQSQRFVDESKASIVVPPAMRGHERVEMMLDESMGEARDTYVGLVDALTGIGLPRKQAREAARAVLPNMTEVRMVVTGNCRSWRDVLSRRLDPSADAEMREVSALILKELKSIAPHSFQDF